MHSEELAWPVEFTLPPKIVAVENVFLTNVRTGYPTLDPTSAALSRSVGLRSHKSVMIARQRTTRQPMLYIPRVDKENELWSFESGLCRSSSGSVIFGYILDPHKAGSGAREY